MNDKDSYPMQKGLKTVIYSALILALLAFGFLIRISYQDHKQLREANSEVREKLKEFDSEVRGIKSEISKKQDFIPPLYGERHIQLRKLFALNQIKQSTQKYALIIGDSITEGFFLPSLNGLVVINAGLGGGGGSKMLETF